MPRVSTCQSEKPINLAMNEFGEDVFMAIARYVGRRKKRRIADVPAKPEQVADIPTSRKP